MHVVSDDERRDVAERLRELEKGVIGVFIPTRELAENVLKAIDYGRSGAMTPYGCLADLIDPGESGQNRDRNQDTVQKESPAVQKAPECDRDALLELVDEMETADPEDLDVAIDYVTECASRIREACGEVVE